MAIWWLELHMFTAEGMDSIPGQGTTIPQTAQQGQERKEEKKKNPPRIRGKNQRKNETIKILKTWLFKTMEYNLSMIQKIQELFEKRLINFESSTWLNIKSKE